jgi:hypothetical protein
MKQKKIIAMMLSLATMLGAELSGFRLACGATASIHALEDEDYLYKGGFGFSILGSLPLFWGFEARASAGYAEAILNTPYYRSYKAPWIAGGLGYFLALGKALRLGVAADYGMHWLDPEFHNPGFLEPPDIDALLNTEMSLGYAFNEDWDLEALLGWRPLFSEFGIFQQPFIIGLRLGYRF